MKRGERGTPIVFWKVIENEKTDGTTSKAFVLRYFTVFNVEQTEGIEAPEATTYNLLDPIEECERIVSGYSNPPRIDHGGGAAFYMPSQDRIQVPGRKIFGTRCVSPVLSRSRRTAHARAHDHDGSEVD